MGCWPAVRDHYRMIFLGHSSSDLPTDNNQVIVRVSDAEGEGDMTGYIKSIASVVVYIPGTVSILPFPADISDPKLNFLLVKSIVGGCCV